MNGFLNLLKVPGMSSGAAVAVVKRLTGERVGHAGTLDPEAAGVLPIMVGRATRLLDFFSDREKEYIAQIAFGCATDTQDSHGTPVETSDKIPDPAQLQEVIPQFTGSIMQRPPAYSAVKKDGRSLYKLARQGIYIEGEPRPAEISDLRVLSQISESVYCLRILCGKGTYIRTLCHDLGQALNCPAHMRFLLRTQSGFFRIENAVTLEEFADAAAHGQAEALLAPMDAPLQGLRRLDVPEDLKKPALNGVALPADLMDAEENERVRVYFDNQLIGIAFKHRDKFKYDMMAISAVEFEKQLKERDRSPLEQ